ncbi:hypothetical protein [Janthinobacterium sp. MDT1-19]|uniref:hypothetical protein n=1 Tax=Janthinobacterium sp. MDT1-19 TaxID=1259339 RepID=UPI003F211E0E
MAKKEPYEMTWEEFRLQAHGNPHFSQTYSGNDPGAYLRDTLHTHRQHLLDAVHAGKHVDATILREHYLIE